MWNVDGVVIIPIASKCHNVKQSKVELIDKNGTLGTSVCIAWEVEIDKHKSIGNELDH